MYLPCTSTPPTVPHTLTHFLYLIFLFCLEGGAGKEGGAQDEKLSAAMLEFRDPIIEERTQDAALIDACRTAYEKYKVSTVLPVCFLFTHRP